jgi:hypothetical protein
MGGFTMEASTKGDLLSRLDAVMEEARAWVNHGGKTDDFISHETRREFEKQHEWTP